MLTAYTLLKPSGATGHGEFDWPEDPGFDRLRAIVEPHLNGQRLERVLVFWEDIYRDMFVGDRSAGHEPINPKATEIYRNNVLVHLPDPGPAEAMPAIYGPAVLFSRRVWF